MDNKKQPHSNESEIIVLASVLIGGTNCFDDVSQIIDASDFFTTSHSILFDACSKVALSGEALDEISALEELRRCGDEDQVGGIAAIYSMMSRVDTPIRARSAAKVVLEKSKLRKLIRVARESIEAANELAGGSDDLIADLEQKLQGITDVSVSGTSHIGAATSELREDIQAMIDGTYETQSLPTGVNTIDSQLTGGGVGKGEVMVITAPTSCGKTQYAIGTALGASVTRGDAGLYFSFEMPAKQLSKRLTQTVSAVSIAKAIDGVLNSSEKKRLNDALDRVEASPIHTEHSVKNIAELRSKARTHKRKHGIKWIVIDYLQLIPRDTSMSKNDAIADISHQIKLMAIELDLPVILLCQVNREGAKRESGLTLHDLKDSGDIENDADIILLMWPDGKDVDEARMIDADGRPYVSLRYNIAKQREGERDLKGTLRFISQFGRFQ